MNKNILFLENFYTLLNAGYSVEETLELCKNIIDISIVDQLIGNLKSGDDIYSCILSAPFPKIFKEYFSFYQTKNCLSDAIEKSLKVYQTKENFQNQLKSKMTYPCVLLLFLFFFSIFVVAILLPNVNHLFESFDIQKSLFTQFLFLIFHIFPVFILILFIVFIFLIIRLLYGLKYKKFKIIEHYLEFPIISTILQKYFSLKFAVYYHELAMEDMDSAMIIDVLNKQMNESDIKIVLYEMNNRMLEGEAIETLLEDFEYLDHLFLIFFKMYIKNPQQYQSIEHYIQLTYQEIDYWISQFIKYFVPCIYAFVALFVITIYISIIIPMMNVVSEI